MEILWLNISLYLINNQCPHRKTWRASRILQRVMISTMSSLYYRIILWQLECILTKICCQIRSCCLYSTLHIEVKPTSVLFIVPLSHKTGEIRTHTRRPKWMCSPLVAIVVWESYKVLHFHNHGYFSRRTIPLERSPLWNHSFPLITNNHEESSEWSCSLRLTALHLSHFNHKWEAGSFTQGSLKCSAD